MKESKKKWKNCTLELNDGFVWWFFNYDKSNSPGFADGQWSLPLPPPPHKIKKLRINGNFMGQVKIASSALVTIAKERVPEIKPSDNLYAKLDQILLIFHREIQENL